MRRREFLSVLAVTATWPFAARAQQSKMPVIGSLSARSADESAYLVAAFRDGLRDSGYVEGQNVAVEYRFAEGHYDRLPALAVELVRSHAAVIVAGTPVGTRAAMTATTTIPIVFVIGSDPVKDGLVGSLNHPSSNVTGVTFFANLVAAKRLELLHQLVPDASVIGVLVNPHNANAESELGEVLTAGQTLGLQFTTLRAADAHEIDASFSTLTQQQVKAIFVTGDALFNAQRDAIALLARQHAVATSFANREQAVAGGLMSYGTSSTVAFRQAGVYAGRILKGAKPGDLPVLQPNKFEFVINLKTARALGLSVPPQLLLIADEVIE